MSKTDPKITNLGKYDVEANIEEADNSEEQSVFKYGFTALSNPKNVRLAIEGIARISGDYVERNEILEKDENDIPKILTLIYNELFPTFFLLSKTLNVSCPPHTISGMGNSSIGKLGEISEPSEPMPAEEVSEDMSESPGETHVEAEESSQEQVESQDVVRPTV